MSYLILKLTIDMRKSMIKVFLDIVQAISLLAVGLSNSRRATGI